MAVIATDTPPETQTKLTETSQIREHGVITKPTVLRLILLGAFAAAVWLIGMRLVAGANAQFNPYAIPVLGWYCFGALLMALVLGKLTRPNIGLGWGAAIVLTLVPIAVLLGYLVQHTVLQDYQFNLYVGCAALAALFMLIRTRTLCGRYQWLPVALTLALAAGFGWLNQRLYVAPELWYSDEDFYSDAQPSYDPGALEALLFNQPRQIDAALAQLRPRAESENAFFLGFAGYAEEKVFAEEIKFAAQIMDARYGSGQRSLLLLNDVRDLTKQPLASTSALQYAVTGIAQQMNLQQDLLIVALSSHGSEEAELAVSNGSLPLRRLGANDLKQALDTAGVRWRLLIVSACFAGSFIETLADPYTAIITAAAPDRTSFGCSNTRNLTYFGEAFYRDALPGAESLRTAFTNAKVLVTEREQAIDVPPSQPVAHFGSEIEAKLRSLRTTPPILETP